VGPPRISAALACFSRRTNYCQLAAQLEINLVLPAEIAGLSATEVVCRGEVVRTIEQEEKL